jgi:pilus assembly protein CpaE
MRRLDRDLLDASVATHRSGVHVVAQGERLEEAEQIDTASVEKLLGFLRQHYSHVIVDGLRRFDELALATLDASDRILLLVTQEVPSVRNAQRCMEIFRKLTYPDERTALVVNRYLKSSNITAQVIGETLGIPVTGTIANDFAATSRAVHRGATLLEEAPRSPIVRDLQALAAVIGGEAKGARNVGMLRRLFARG